MSSEERTRIQVAFEGGQAITVLVPSDAADALSQALQSGRDDAVVIEAEDGDYTVALKRVVYVKRFARESRVGFGTA